MGANGDDTSADTRERTMRFYNGHIRRVVDEKHRLNIPARYRDAHYPEFHALPDAKNPCLKLLNIDALRRMHRILDESDEFTPEEKKKFRTLWFGHAIPCPLDKQGRIVVPPELQQRYRFAEEVVIVGACEHLELWRPEDWDRYNGEEETRSVEAMAAKLGF